MSVSSGRSALVRAGGRAAHGMRTRRVVARLQPWNGFFAASTLRCARSSAKWRCLVLECRVLPVLETGCGGSGSDPAPGSWLVLLCTAADAAGAPHPKESCTNLVNTSEPRPLYAYFNARPVSGAVGPELAANVANDRVGRKGVPWRQLRRQSAGTTDEARARSFSRRTRHRAASGRRRE
jgi:hypothetical protein